MMYLQQADICQNISWALTDITTPCIGTMSALKSYGSGDKERKKTARQMNASAEYRIFPVRKICDCGKYQ